jgi:hypothetical protein
LAERPEAVMLKLPNLERGLTMHRGRRTTKYLDCLVKPIKPYRIQKGLTARKINKQRIQKELRGEL